MALSSFGALGLIYLRILEVLDRFNIPNHAVSETSMGAFVSVLFECGIPTDETKYLKAEIGNPQTFLKLAVPTFTLPRVFCCDKANFYLEKR